MQKNEKIGFGGGCHWCTEAVFMSLNGVDKVEQGWIASTGGHHAFSEAVIVHYNPDKIPLSVLTEIHLRTHKSTSNHSMRFKYRSAIYIFSEKQQAAAEAIIMDLQSEFDNALITDVFIPFVNFRSSAIEFQNYYYNNPEKPFCKSYIHPKLKLLLNRYSEFFNHKKITGA